MTTKTIPLTTVSVQAVKPATRFGSLSVVPVLNANMLGRIPLTGIPAGATIQSAILSMWQYKAGSGSVLMTAKAATSAWSTSTTWNTRPSTTTTNAATQTRTSPAAQSEWDLDVTAIVQAWVSGTLANNGLLIYGAGTPGTLRGATAAWGPPRITITYVVPAVAPTALHPSSGAVSLAKPTLTFQTPSDTLSIQVQIDPAANGTTPAFDSGEVVSPAGLLDLTTTSYAGLADGSSTQWRSRVKNSLGWSAWSSWVTFSRAAWKTATVTSPTTTSEDPPPVITGTYGGTITSWRALLKTSLGKVIQDSGWTPGTTPAFGTTKSVGATGTAVLQIRDNVLRDATPGDPDYVEATKAFTVTPSGTPTAVASVAVSQDGVSPVVTVTSARASGVPDEVAIYRNGQLVDRVAGAEVFSGTTMTYPDKTAPMNVAATYTVYAIVNGAWSNAASASVITPTCKGVWLFDTESTEAAMLLDVVDPEQTQPEIAIVHRPVSGPDGQAQVVRRRLSRYPREGTLEGTLADALGVTAATSEAALRDWAENNDAGHIYRLVMGNQNDPVILGDIDFDEESQNGGANGRVLGVSASWWYQS